MFGIVWGSALFHLCQLERSVCLALPSWQDQAGFYAVPNLTGPGGSIPCRSAQSWPGSDAVQAVPGVGVSSVTLGTPLHGSGPLLPQGGVGVDT